MYDGFLTKRVSTVIKIRRADVCVRHIQRNVNLCTVHPAAIHINDLLTNPNNLWSRLKKQILRAFSKETRRVSSDRAILEAKMKHYKIVNELTIFRVRLPLPP